MKKYKLISFDMFQTLVDITTQKDQVMKGVFGEGWTKEKGDLLWEDANAFVYARFHRMCAEKEAFSLTRDIFEQCYASLFPKYGIRLAPGEGADILCLAHGKAGFYRESAGTFAKIQARYKTCLISDTDDSMVRDLLEKIPFDRVYTSERYASYKSDASGKLFRAAIGDFGIRPGEMLHIGDGYNDVAGAKAVGADAVWVNRAGRKWEHEIKPDYIVASLDELDFLQ